MDKLSPGLERGGRCWITLALAADGQPAKRDDGSTGTAVDRCWRQLRRFTEKITPIPALDLTRRGIRRPGRVLLSSEQARDRAASSRWRLEFAPRPAPGRRLQGLRRPAATRSPRGGRCDLLETWLLTELELLADHARETAAFRAGESRCSAPAAHPRRLRSGGTAVNARRARRRAAERGRLAGRRPPGIRSHCDSPEHRHSHERTRHGFSGGTRRTGQARDDRQLAVELLEHFGVEQTTVLQPDGTLNAFRRRPAGSADRPSTHRAARAASRPHLPLERRSKYDEKAAEARRWLRP